LKRVGGNVDAGAGLSVAGLWVPISKVGMPVNNNGGAPTMVGGSVKTSVK
jgi:hypothetical protein